MKKDKLIVAFYILYFTWLFTLTYLTRNPQVINIFSIAVIGFYFAFLREPGDLLWFWVAALLPFFGRVYISQTNGASSIGESIITTPLWLPLAWGTTVVALRKLYLRITS